MERYYERDAGLFRMRSRQLPPTMLRDTPSGRAFEYIERQSGINFVGFREISRLFA